ncbi:chemotaxis protein CheW [Stenotrophomonas sp. W1S232]|jgi:chemosensory pili system protein ChpC|uniref:Chemotaxis protein CheW n=1 Tax=Stenotrophomonas koreensis TaxID=266128 RepID=A0A7W3YW92_9GAMM|nr:chemotaxis protein CheW [Stenotrophomonas koreensis]MBB1117678.1 chemotaxis protein CheW [Stenotrophomonas koreensis]
MNHMSNDEVRGVVLQCAGEKVLLPNATVAEVMSRVQLQPAAEGAPAWLAGTLAWQGFDVPVVAFGRFTGLGSDLLVGQLKVVVLKALGGQVHLPYYALLTESFPQLIAVPRDGLLADASEEIVPVGVHMRVLLGEQTALLPDLEAVEAAVLSSLATAA